MTLKYSEKSGIGFAKNKNTEKNRFIVKQLNNN